MLSFCVTAVTPSAVRDRGTDVPYNAVGGGGHDYLC